MRSTSEHGFFAALLPLLICIPAIAAEQFPFEQDLLLDAAPMRPGKRMPMLNVEPGGNARIDLWCRTAPAHIEVSDTAIKVEAGPLPDGMPEVMSAGQCTPERMQGDEELLSALNQATGWRREGEGIVLEGAQTLKFRLSDH
jgi:hypothetical protein